MNSKFVFSEDSRKYRLFLYILTIIAYISFITQLILGILYQCDILPNLKDGNKLIIISIGCLILAIYLSWALSSSYLKYFMYISNKEIEFYCNKKTNKFELTDLISYEILKKSSQIMGGYWIFKLNFINSSFTITSFKGQQLEDTLKILLKK